MDRRKVLLLLGALLVAASTALAARSLLAGSPMPIAAAAAAHVPDGPRVLVARRALPVGTILTPDSVAFQAWPKDSVQDAYFAEGQPDAQKLVGTVVRHPVTAGQPLTRGALVAPGDRGFLAAALGPGMRAVTIPVSARTGVAGFVFPGDHVDLVLTQTVKGQTEVQPLRASETIIRNLRVLATDQSTEQEAVDGKTRVRTFSLVTVEVTPRMAEEVSVAQSIGTISLSLRAIADSAADLDNAMAAGAVTMPRGTGPAEEARLLHNALERPTDGATSGGRATSFVTGGDVSRFQRRTMPTEATINGTPPPGTGPVTASPAVVMHGPVVHVTRGKDTQEINLGMQGMAQGGGY